MVPNIEYDCILLLGYSILYKEYYLTRFKHQQKHYSILAVTNLRTGHRLALTFWCKDLWTDCQGLGSSVLDSPWFFFCLSFGLLTCGG